MIRATKVTTNTNGDGLMAWQAAIEYDSVAALIDNLDNYTGIDGSAKVIENGDGYDIVRVVAHGVIVVYILTDEERAATKPVHAMTQNQGLK